MTDIDITRNVLVTGLSVSVPDEYTEVTSPAARIDMGIDIVATPTLSMYPEMTIDVNTEIAFDEPTLTYTGTEVTISTTATDCRLWSGYSPSFSATGTYLGLGCWVTNFVGGVYYTANFKSWIPFVVAIAQGTTILSAILEVYCSQSNTAVGSNRQYWAAERSANAVAPTTYDELNLKAYTANKTTDSGSPIWVLGTKYSIDVTTCVQEVINYTSWVSGNTLAIMTGGSSDSSSNNKVFASYENTTYTEPKLVINY